MGHQDVCARSEYFKLDKKMSNETKKALYAAGGAISGYFLAKTLRMKHPILLVIGGSIAGTISSQQGEWKRLLPGSAVL